MALSWGFKTQLKFFAIFAVAVLAIVGALVYYFWPSPTCFDNRQNQDEEAVDCGGANCIPCANQIHDLTIFWTRALKISDGVYDVAALVENSNQFLKATKLDYFIKLYDVDNILIAIKENSTFAGASEKFVIYEPNIQTLNRVPSRAILEISSVNWTKSESSLLKIDILKTQNFSDLVEADIKNQSTAPYKNIGASVVLLGAADAVLGVSKTVIENIGIGDTKTITFTWPSPIPGVEHIEIFLRQLQ